MSNSKNAEIKFYAVRVKSLVEKPRKRRYNSRCPIDNVMPIAPRENMNKTRAQSHL